MENILLLIVTGLILLTNIILLIKFSTIRKEDNNIELKSKLQVLGEALNRVETSIRNEISGNRDELSKSLKENREEVGNNFKGFGESIVKTLTDIATLQKGQLETFSTHLSNLTKVNEEKIDKLTTAVETKLNSFQEKIDLTSKENRGELTNSLKSFQESFSANVKEFNELQKQKFDSLLNKQGDLNTTTDIRLEKIRETIEGKLKTLQDENIKKLEEMRATVDEKLQATVEKRFNESFKLISERLEQVHKGLGEMQTLASGVGDLKKVLSNVKTRGTLGEIQLGAILEQMLSPEQYEKNAVIKSGTSERVEYAVRFPNKTEENKPLLLPIDSKFPVEDYQRLIEAYEGTGDIDSASKQFEASVKKCAKDICSKYINPPVTTDFAIMFVPTEGLYAEVIRRTGLFELLQRDYKVVVVGPSNLAAFLSSLQMGFRTLAIEKRSSEVWEILGAVKTEFGRFGTILEKTKKKLQEATNVIDEAGVRSRAIERKLKTVQELPKEQTAALIGEAIEIELDNETEEGEEKQTA